MGQRVRPNSIDEYNLKPDVRNSIVKYYNNTSLLVVEADPQIVQASVGGELYTLIDSAFTETALTSAIVLGSGIAAKQWARSEWYVQQKEINISYWGSDADAINNAVTYAGGINGSKITAPANTTYDLAGDSIVITGKSIIFDFSSSYGTKIRQAVTTAPAFVIKGSHIKTTFNNVLIVGGGKGNDAHIAIDAQTLGAGSDIVIQNTRIDSFDIVLKTYDQTSVKVSDSRFAHNNICMLPLYQSDAFYFENTKFYDSDTVLVTGSDASNTSGPFSFNSCIFGRDSLGFMLHNQNVILNLYFNYFEDMGTIMLSGSDGVETVGNNINVVGNWFQGTDRRGLVMQGAGLLYFMSNQGSTTALDSAWFVEINNNAARFMAFGNTMTDVSATSRVASLDTHTLPINNFTNYSLKIEEWYDMNQLTVNNSESVWDKTTGINAIDRYWKVWERVNGGDAARQYAAFVRDLDNFPVIGLETKGGFQAPENSSLPTAAADYKGMIWHYLDNMYLCTDDGSGGYMWKNVSNQSSTDTSAYYFYGDDIYAENAAGYSDATKGSNTDGYDYTRWSFPDAALGAVQVYLFPEFTIDTNDKIWVDIIWESGDTANDIVWGVQYGIQGEGAQGGFSGATTSTVTVPGTAGHNKRTRIELTATSDITPRDQLIIRPRRAGADAGDTASTAYLISVVVRHLGGTQ